MDPKSKEFKKLQKTWYAKLKKNGFEDAETDEDHLKVWSTRWARERYVAEAESRAAYYELANKFLQEHKFSSNLQKVIWEYHSKGVSYRDISKTLKKARIKKISYTIVWKIIKELRATMQAKYVQT